MLDTLVLLVPKCWSQMRGFTTHVHFTQHHISSIASTTLIISNCPWQCTLTIIIFCNCYAFCQYVTPNENGVTRRNHTQTLNYKSAQMYLDPRISLIGLLHVKHTSCEKDFDRLIFFCISSIFSITQR